MIDQLDGGLPVDFEQCRHGKYVQIEVGNRNGLRELYLVRRALPFGFQSRASNIA